MTPRILAYAAATGFCKKFKEQVLLKFKKKILAAQYERKTGQFI
jgi:hypothetical protein